MAGSGLEGWFIASWSLACVLAEASFAWDEASAGGSLAVSASEMTSEKSCVAGSVRKGEAAGGMEDRKASVGGTALALAAEAWVVIWLCLCLKCCGEKGEQFRKSRRCGAPAFDLF